MSSAKNCLEAQAPFAGQINKAEDDKNYTGKKLRWDRCIYVLT
jgi:hypothetical protein